MAILSSAYEERAERSTIVYHHTAWARVVQLFTLIPLGAVNPVYQAFILIVAAVGSNSRLGQQ